MQTRIKNYRKVLKLEKEINKLKKKYGSSYHKNYNKIFKVIEKKYSHGFESAAIIFDEEEEFCFEFITKGDWPTYTVKAAFKDIPWNEIYDHNIEHWAFFIIKNVEATIRKWR